MVKENSNPKINIQNFQTIRVFERALDIAHFFVCLFYINFAGWPSVNNVMKIVEIIPELMHKNPSEARELCNRLIITFRVKLSCRTV